ncbi:MAG: hypothetical protein LBQ62_01165 [Candidatus Accumulibacter sp.]|nr:hypothetical protein [Accumulibacter sp.]
MKLTGFESIATVTLAGDEILSRFNQLVRKVKETLDKQANRGERNKNRAERYGHAKPVRLFAPMCRFIPKRHGYSFSTDTFAFAPA